MEFNIKIRIASKEDKEFLAHTFESNKIFYDPIMPKAFQKQADKFRKHGLSNKYNTFIIQLDNTDIGFLGTVILSNSYLYLAAFYLEVKYQRKGIGKVVLRKIINYCANRSIKKILLLVHNKAFWAKEFYLKNNFKYISNLENEIKNYASNILKMYYISNTELLYYELT